MTISADASPLATAYMAAVARYAPLPGGSLPSHIVEVEGSYFVDTGTDVVAVPGQEILWTPLTLPSLDRDANIPGAGLGCYVHACPIPSGHLEQLVRITELRQRSVTSQVRFVADTKREKEGYTSDGEFARAMMREHLQDTAHISAAVADTAVVGDKLVRYGHIPPANDSNAPDYRLPKPRRPRVFEPSMTAMVESPAELIDTEAYDRDLAAALRHLIGLSDWDPAMAYGQLKQWDQQTLAYETLRTSTIEYAATKTAEIERLYREADARGDEIPRAQVERLNEQLQGLRMQVFDYSRRFKTCLIERERAVQQSGINFPAYLSLAQRKVTAQAKRRSRVLAQVEVDRLNAMTPEARITALKAVARSGVASYRPRRDGVEGANSQDPIRIGTED